jgi:hypothetical protein
MGWSSTVSTSDESLRRITFAVTLSMESPGQEEADARNWTSSLVRNS